MAKKSSMISAKERKIQRKQKRPMKKVKSMREDGPKNAQPQRRSDPFRRHFSRIKERPIMRRKVTEHDKSTTLSRRNPALYQRLVDDGLIALSEDHRPIKSDLALRDERDIKSYAKKLKLDSSSTISGELRKDGLGSLLDQVNMAMDGDAQSNSDMELQDDVLLNESSLEADTQDEDDEEDVEPAENHVAAAEEDTVRKSRVPADPSRTEEMATLRKHLQGQLNRLSNENVIAIFKTIELAYGKYPRREVTEILADRMLNLLSNDAVILEAFVLTYSCLVCLIFCAVGHDVGAHFVQMLVEELLASFKSAVDGENGSTESIASKRSINLQVMVCFLYSFKVVSAQLLCDMMNRYVDSGFSEVAVELILKGVKLSGFRLRSESPESMKGFLQKISSASSSFLTGGSRMKFMLETIADLKNNRMKSFKGTDYVDTVERLRKSIKTLLKERSSSAPEPLNCTLDDIENIEARGRWWVVGAPWKGRSEGNVPESKPTNRSEDDIHLLQTARRLGVNTDVRRSVFLTLMRSEDYSEALLALRKLNLNSSQSREIPRMILVCCSSEKGFNNYYYLIAFQLCREDRSNQVTFQYCLWDFIKTISDRTSVRKVTNVSLLYGKLLAHEALPIGVLRGFDFAQLIQHVSHVELPPASLAMQLILVSILAGDGHERTEATRIERIFSKVNQLDSSEKLAVGLRACLTYHIRKRASKEVPQLLQLIRGESSAREEDIKFIVAQISAVKALLKGRNEFA